MRNRLQSDHLSSGRVLIFETSPSGHRLVFVRLLAEEALSRGMSVVLATTEEVVHDERFDRHLGDLSPKLNTADAKLVSTVRGLQRLADSYGCTLVLVPDVLKYGIRFLLGSSSGAPLTRMLIMNDPRWHLSSPRFGVAIGLVKLALFQLSGYRRGVQLLWLRPQGAAQTPSTVIDPLVLEDGPESTLAQSAMVKRRLDMTPSIFWFGVVGGLDERKNVPLVIEALAEVAHRTERSVGLALLGPWGDEVLSVKVTESLKSAPFAHVSYNENLTNREMNVMVGTLDCAVMAYSTNAPNSTTAKASALGVRVVAAGSDSFRGFAQLLTGHPGVRLSLDDLVSEMLLATERPRPQPRVLVGPEGLTRPFLASDRNRP